MNLTMLTIQPVTLFILLSLNRTGFFWCRRLLNLVLTSCGWFTATGPQGPIRPHFTTGKLKISTRGPREPVRLTPLSTSCHISHNHMLISCDANMSLCTFSFFKDHVNFVFIFFMCLHVLYTAYIYAIGISIMFLQLVYKKSIYYSFLY